MQEKKKITSIRNLFAAAATAGLATPAAAQAVTVGSLSATMAPWMLLAVPAVMALWWVMKSIPQERLKQIFPGIQLLAKVKREEPAPTRMPWWQYVPITLATAAVVGALAKPEWNPQAPLEGTGPVMLVVDNGWSAARNWKMRTIQMENLIARADRAGRSVIIVPTAAPTDGSPLTAIGPVSAADALRQVREMKPNPWPTQRQEALQALGAVKNDQKTSVIWLSDGLDDDKARALAEKLQTYGTLTVFEDEQAVAPRLIDQPAGLLDKLTVTVRRAQTSNADKFPLIVADQKGQPLGSSEAVFKSGESKAEVTFELPTHVANDITSVSIEGDNTAGARVLIDERFRRRPVGVIQTGTDSLANESRYPVQALGPYVDLHQGTVDDLLKRKLAVIIMPDGASNSPGLNKKIEKWVNEEGGTLLRFAGRNLSQQENIDSDPLLPLKLRKGSRSLGGDASGSKEARIAPFAAKSPFAGITVPADVTIREEVLPQPGTDTDENTWARLDNGTPLVTAKKHGKGQIVLVHTSADPSWSNLAYSSAYIEMLRAVVTTSQGVADKLENGDISLPAVKVMDGQGKLGAPGPSVRPLTTKDIDDADVGPRHPPGFYGNQSLQQAHNLSVAVPELKPLGKMPEGTHRKIYEAVSKDTDLTGYMWGGAFAFLLVDMMLMAWQRRGKRAPAQTEKRKSTLAP